MRSRIKWFNDRKGYGFIEYKDTEDIFVHYSTIVSNGYKTLKTGETVDFNLIQTNKGLQATEVKHVCNS